MPLLAAEPPLLVKIFLGFRANKYEHRLDRGQFGIQKQPGPAQDLSLRTDGCLTLQLEHFGGDGNASFWSCTRRQVRRRWRSCRWSSAAVSGPGSAPAHPETSSLALWEALRGARQQGQGVVVFELLGRCAAVLLMWLSARQPQSSRDGSTTRCSPAGCCVPARGCPCSNPVRLNKGTGAEREKQKAPGLLAVLLE